MISPNDLVVKLRDVAVTHGMGIAKQFFVKRGGHSEVHIDEATLAGIVAVGFELGVETMLPCVKDLVEANDKIASLNQELAALRGGL